jgi:hypothetical protein
MIGRQQPRDRAMFAMGTQRADDAGCDEDGHGAFLSTIRHSCQI